MSKYMLGIPAGKISLTSFWQNVISYVTNNNLPLSIQSSNRVDLNRSGLIETAINSNSDLIMLDSDVVIVSKMHEIRQYLKEDFTNKEIGMVIAPTIGVGGVLITQPPKNPAEKVWEVEAGGLGFCALPNEVLNKLPVICNYVTIGGGQTPMRVVYATNTSEDIMLCQSLAQLGYKILVDSRIKVNHIQSVALTYPENWNSKYHL